MSTSFHICGSRTVNANLVPAATISAPLCWFGHGISNHHLATKCSLNDSAHVKSRVKIKESPLKKVSPQLKRFEPKRFLGVLRKMQNMCKCIQCTLRGMSWIIHGFSLSQISWLSLGHALLTPLGSTPQVAMEDLSNAMMHSSRQVLSHS